MTHHIGQESLSQLAASGYVSCLISVILRASISEVIKLIKIT